MPGPLAIGATIGRFLFSGTQWFAGAAALDSAIQQAGQSLTAEEYDFVCKYRDELNAGLDLFRSRVEVAVNRAHWSAFSYAPLPTITEAVRVKSLIIRELVQGNITGPALYALNFHKDYTRSINASGETIAEPEGLWPGTHAQRERDFEAGEFFHHIQPQFDEDRPQALWDGGQLMVSRPVPCQGSRCHQRERPPGDPIERIWQLPPNTDMPDLGSNRELGDEARLSHEYYSLPPSRNESSRTASRQWFADPFYGPTMFRGKCGHMDARVLLVICGTLDEFFQNAAASTLRGDNNNIIFSFDEQWMADAGMTDAGRGLAGSPNQELLRRVSETISKTGYNNNGTGIIQLISEKNELTASSLPLESPLGGVTVDLWNGAYGMLDATLLGMAPNELYAGDPCGKDPCGIG